MHVDSCFILLFWGKYPLMNFTFYQNMVISCAKNLSYVKTIFGRGLRVFMQICKLYFTWPWLVSVFNLKKRDLDYSILLSNNDLSIIHVNFKYLKYRCHSVAMNDYRMIIHIKLSCNIILVVSSDYDSLCMIIHIRLSNAKIIHINHNI